MILDEVCYSAFIQFCTGRVILPRMVEPYLSVLEQVLSDLPGTLVSGRLSTPLCFPFDATLLM